MEIRELQVVDRKAVLIDGAEGEVYFVDSDWKSVRSFWIGVAYGV
jgi:hypothetical protein